MEPKVYYSVRKNTPVMLILSQKDPFHTTQFTFLRSIFIFFHPHLELPSGLFPSGFATKILYIHLFSYICAAITDHLILPKIIILIMFGKKYQLQTSSLCNFLQSQTILSHFCTNILPESDSLAKYLTYIESKYREGKYFLDKDE
jgi:hypothetical protein